VFWIGVPAPSKGRNEGFIKLNQADSAGFRVIFGCRSEKIGKFAEFLRVVLEFGARWDYARAVTANFDLLALAEAAQKTAEEAPVNLVLVCIVAFITVMTILSVLALIFRGLTHLFPEVAEVAKAKPTTTDAATVGAIHAAVAKLVPGGRVARIEPLDKD